MRTVRENHPGVNLNLNVRGMTASATLAIQEQCAAIHCDRTMKAFELMREWVGRGA